jgi:hypothetical protein
LISKVVLLYYFSVLLCILNVKYMAHRNYYKPTHKLGKTSIICQTPPLEFYFEQ